MDDMVYTPQSDGMLLTMTKAKSHRTQEKIAGG
jgi:hypothetical protein